MKFKTWIEQKIPPASAEVIRTGLQPQVDAQTPVSQDNDKLLAVDGQMKRLGELSNRCSGKMKEFLQKMLGQWEKVKKAPVQPVPQQASMQQYAPVDQKAAEFMKNNQPPRETGLKDPRPGIFGNN